MSSRLVAADIVTGFLGSGKTTLLKGALRRSLGRPGVALIVNDFGDIGIDGATLQGLNVDRMVELPAGCVCCTVGSQFALAVQEILDTVKPYLLVIETSGVADPEPLVSELSLVGVRTDAIITVVDAENLHRALGESVAARSQVEAADFLVLNKTDLVSSRDIDRATRALRKLNGRAALVTTTFGGVDEDILFATSSGAPPREAAPVARNGGAGAHVEKDRITSFSFQKSGLAVRSRLERLLEELPPEVYRAKGIVKFRDEAWSSIFNYTCGRARVDWLQPTTETPFSNRGVLIGRDLDKVRDHIVRRLEECVEGV